MVIDKRVLVLPTAMALACVATVSAGTLTPSITGSGVGALSPANAEAWTVTNRTQENAVFEVNFDYQNESQAHVLFEVGGGTDGASLYLDGDRLIWHTRDDGAINGIDVISTDISASLNNTNIQVVVGMSMNSNGLNETIKIFVNGVSVASDDTQDQGSDWAGANGSALGTAGSGPATPITTIDFGVTDYDDGSIDFAFYAVATYPETFDQVLADVVIPEPSSLALLGLGGLLIARRRR